MRRLLVCLPLALAACYTPRSLDKLALRHEDKADVLAERGDGPGAAYQRELAASRRLKADLRAKKESIWVQSEWRME